MQRNMPWDMVLKVSYAGRLGRRLLAQTDVNQVLDFPDSTGLSNQTLAEAFASVTQQSGPAQAQQRSFRNHGLKM